MRVATTAAWFAAAVTAAAVVSGCTSSTSTTASDTTGNPGTGAGTQANAPATPGTSSAPLDPSSHAASTSGVPPKTSASASRSSQRPPAPTAVNYLMHRTDLGTGFKTTTQVDATIRPLCKGVAPADTRRPYRTTAQLGFFDPARRVLVTEKITTYGTKTAAAHVHDLLLSFDCAGNATYNGQKATYTAPRKLGGAVMKQIDSGGQVDVSTARAKVVLASERSGTQVAQLTIVSMGGPAPSSQLVALVTLKAAQRLS